MAKIIQPSGSKDAKICIVGEMPGMDETYTGRPFVGSSGKLLDRLLATAGISRDSCYLTYLVKQDPPGHKLERMKEIGLNLETCKKTLLRELSQNNHNVIVPLGNLALETLTGQKSIMKYRGSILESTTIPGQKVIGTIHPAAAMRQYEVTAYMAADLARIKKEGEFPDFRSILKRTEIVQPTYEQVMEELEYLKKNAVYLSVDIETPYGAAYIKSIGLGCSSTRAICIPFVDKQKIYWSEAEEIEIWKGIKYLLTGERYYKIFQNGSFDTHVLHSWVGDITPIYMDTMLAQKLCYPELKKGLDMICSLYTTQSYYKDDGKNSNYDSIEGWSYNCKDVMVTYEAAMALGKELEQYNLTDFFHGYTMPLSAVMRKAERKGILLDQVKMKEHFEEQVKKYNELQPQLNEMAGRAINVNSHPQVRKLLYQDLGMTPIRSSKSISDEKALTLLARKYPKHKQLIDMILLIRGVRILLSTFLGGRLDNKSGLWSHTPYMLADDDGYVRTSLQVEGTDTGRMASSKNYRERACNIQNQPSSIRDIYIAGKGRKLVVGDLSQADARFVAWLAEERGLKKIFKDGGDIHTAVASWIFRIPAIQITKEQRNMCKRVVHGANYDIGYKQFAYAVKITEAESKRVLHQFHSIFPRIRAWHKELVQQLSKTRTLTSPLGRRRQFFGWWGDQLNRAAYANIPQGLTGDTINMALVRLSFRLPKDAYIILQVHDEGGINCAEKDAERIKEMFIEEAELPIQINGDDISIPLDAGIGDNWKIAKP